MSDPKDPASLSKGDRLALYRDVPLAPPLAVALKERDADALRRALGDGALANARDPKGKTPLMLAAEAWWVEGVEILLHARADPMALTRHGDDAVSLALSWVEKTDATRAHTVVDRIVAAREASGARGAVSTE